VFVGRPPEWIAPPVTDFCGFRNRGPVDLDAEAR
jgi:hypothetical protein